VHGGPLRIDLAIPDFLYIQMKIEPTRAARQSTRQKGTSVAVDVMAGDSLRPRNGCSHNWFLQSHILIGYIEVTCIWKLWGVVEVTRGGGRVADCRPAQRARRGSVRLTAGALAASGVT
jgi:hypothetical protein